MPRFHTQQQVLLILLGFMSLTACISQQGIAPQAEVLDPNALSISNTLAEVQHDAAWPTEKWWHVYGDTQLDALIEMALKHSPTLDEAQSRIRAAQALTEQVGAAQQPRIDADGSLNRKHWPSDYFYGPGELGDTNSWDNTALVSMDYDLDLWGKHQHLDEQSLQQLQAQVAQSRRVALVLEGNIIRSYIALSLTTHELKLASIIVEQQQLIRDVTQSRWQAGLATQLDINQCQTQLINSQMQLTRIQEQYALIQHQLAALTGQGPDSTAQLSTPELQLDHGLTLPATLPAELIGHRPDVVASRWLIAAQNSGIEAARAAFYPNINLTAAVGFMAVQGATLGVFNNNKLTYGVGPAVSLPLFDGGRLRGQLKHASAEYDTAVAQYQQTVVNALKEIADAVSHFQSSMQLKQQASSSLAVASDSVDLAESAYQQGLTNFIAVAQAVIARCQQQHALAQSQALQLLSYSQLMIALGGGVTQPEDNPDPALLSVAAEQ